MRKLLLVLFIVVDLAAMSGAAFILYSSITDGRHRVLSVLPKMDRGPISVMPNAITASTSAVTSSVPATVVSIPMTPTTAYRNIGFTYKNTRARQVLIRADFTGWKGVPMKRDAGGVWSYQAQLVPGEYAYCFTVDDKIIKDPASKHTKRIAQTLVSAITVEKAPVKVSP